MYYAVMQSGWGEVIWWDSSLDEEVADARTAEGGEVGAGTKVVGKVGYEGSDVGPAAAGYVESGRLVVRVIGEEVEGVDEAGTRFTLDGDALAVQGVESDAPALES